jgi:hypothetical protein
MRWNKRLMFGSLVCLSSDGFREQVAFASVADRQPLEKGHTVVGLHFDEHSLTSEALIRELCLHRFVMVESPAFFESYKHVLIALQVVKI